MRRQQGTRLEGPRQQQASCFSVEWPDQEAYDQQGPPQLEQALLTRIEPVTVFWALSLVVVLAYMLERATARPNRRRIPLPNSVSKGTVARGERDELSQITARLDALERELAMCGASDDTTQLRHQIREVSARRESLLVGLWETTNIVVLKPIGWTESSARPRIRPRQWAPRRDARRRRIAKSYG